MSGLVKAKKYDWKDSNLALFGSDTEKNVKKESAETEPAWKGAGQNVGLQIWRIVKFKVEHWDKEKYGKFYNGDSYIILNTYKNKDSDELEYDLHFWIGKNSTQDEYGTAAYKTVELDTLLDDKPVQHREVENNESELFKSYFPELSLMEGGADSGFRHVEEEEFKPYLLHVGGAREKVIIKQIPKKLINLKTENAYIIDLGDIIYQWVGCKANIHDKMKINKQINRIRSERGGKPVLIVLDNQESGAIIADNDEDRDRILKALDDDDDEEEDEEEEELPEKKLLKVSDAGGKLEWSEIASGSDVNNRRAQLQSEDVFIVDSGKHCFVWIGSKASEKEKKNGLPYAHKYLMSTKHPLVPVTCLKEGKETKEFINAWK